MKLIGVTGRAGSGKDTIGRYLHDIYGYTSMALADPLKTAAAVLFDVSLNCFYGKQKELLLPGWPYTAREVVQKLGTECMRRVFSEGHWLQLLERRCSGLTAVVVTDIRFDNEAEWVLSKGGEVWEVLRPGTASVRAHESENGVREELVSVKFFNEGSIEDLYKSVDRMMKRSEGSPVGLEGRSKDRW